MVGFVGCWPARYETSTYNPYPEFCCFVFRESVAEHLRQEVTQFGGVASDVLADQFLWLAFLANAEKKGIKLFPFRIQI